MNDKMELKRHTVQSHMMRIFKDSCPLQTGCNVETILFCVGNIYTRKTVVSFPRPNRTKTKQNELELPSCVSWCLSLGSLRCYVNSEPGRYHAVVYPFHSPFVNSKRCSLFILGTWIIAMAIQSPFFIANELVQYPTAVIECEPHWENVFRDTSEFLDYANRLRKYKSTLLYAYGVDCL